MSVIISCTVIIQICCEVMLHKLYCWQILFFSYALNFINRCFGSLFIFQGPYFQCFGFIHAKNVNSVCMYTTMSYFDLSVMSNVLDCYYTYMHNNSAGNYHRQIKLTHSCIHADRLKLTHCCIHADRLN